MKLNSNNSLNNSLKKIKAFTLLEVMIAVVVIAITMSGAYSALNSFVNVEIQLRERYMAQQNAWNLAVEQLFEKDTSEQKNSFTQNAIKWYWQKKIEQTGLGGFYRISVNVGTSQGSYSNTIQFYQPLAQIDFSTIASVFIDVEPEKK